MRELDLASWPFQEHYRFFRQMDFQMFHICVNIDVTHFLRYTKERGLPFYPAMIYAAMRGTDEIEEFRYRTRGPDRVIVHDYLHPGFTDVAGEGGLFKMVRSVGHHGLSMEQFCRRAKEASASQQQMLPREPEPDDMIFITCLPWISFTDLGHTISLDPESCVPQVSWGKYFVQNGRTLLPFSVQVSHALMAGYHVAKYIDWVQQYIDSL
ncbi:chloramphenicol acetyltransferase [Neobittarella massiliensis]|uniref:Chloramphenicol acetyltransferase n=1 Tax=Neobittarella massiliensis (ex Bilen et al. 2018) TaxID=2041842 RepID=A0A8J6M1C0_9FIRM|nr:CatA-like O-acetyltransferase [Neobittarella massiliensis]MBC3516166.1 chloramphenicol acetyltransferase [Neobittarella massiliensis]